MSKEKDARNEGSYYLFVDRVPYEVTREVYVAYQKNVDAGKYQVRKERKHQVVSYDALDERSKGKAVLVGAKERELVEDLIIKQSIREELKKGLEQLSKEELMLILGLFYFNQSEEALAVKMGVSQSTISRKKVKIIEKLKKFVKN